MKLQDLANNQNYIIIHKELIRKLGLLTACYYSYLATKYNTSKLIQIKGKNYVELKQSDIESEFGISVYMQNVCKKELINCNLIKVIRKSKQYYYALLNKDFAQPNKAKTLEKIEITENLMNEFNSLYNFMSDVNMLIRKDEQFRETNLKAYLKLRKSYNFEQINSAIMFAYNHHFWYKQLQSITKLTKKNKDGVLYIDFFNFLSNSS